MRYPQRYKPCILYVQNSTGMLAPLNNMIAVSRDEEQSNGDIIARFFEWEGIRGVPAIIGGHQQCRSYQQSKGGRITNDTRNICAEFVRQLSKLNSKQYRLFQHSKRWIGWELEPRTLSQFLRSLFLSTIRRSYLMTAIKGE